MARQPARPPRPAAVQAGVDYALQVAAGAIDVCRLTRLAAARFLTDLADAGAGVSPWQFRDDLAEAPMLLASVLPNIKGPLAGQPLELMPWQCFIFCNLFGFVERGTVTRRFRQGVIFVPRGNGKTTLAAPVALFLSFVDGEGGAEGYAAAVTREQARILFDVALHMVKQSPAFRSRYGVAIGANALYQERTASKFAPLSSDAKSLDGKNVQVAVCDEIGSHKTSQVYDVLLTATGKRLHPMLLSISTATGNNTGVGKQLLDYGVRVLEGAQVDDRLFCVVYTIDPDDDPWDERVWRKANPGWGVTVQPDAIRAIMRQARNNPAQEAAAKTKHLNVWVGADEALFSTRQWLERYRPGLSLDDCEGRDCFLALDLASKTDLAAVALLFPSRDQAGRVVYDVFARCYLNAEAVLEARNPSYPGWAAAGWITITPGAETDFGQIETDLAELCGRFNVLGVGYDPWAATQLSQRLREQGVPMIEYRATTQNFSEPTKELDAAIRSGRLSHDGNPVLSWCIGNVVGHYDARSNVYPRKFRPEQKIDAAITVIMAIGLQLHTEPVGPSVYETRELLVL